MSFTLSDSLYASLSLVLLSRPMSGTNPYSATLLSTCKYKLFSHPLEVVFRHRNAQLQLQVGENYSYIFLKS